MAKKKKSTKPVTTTKTIQTSLKTKDYAVKDLIHAEYNPRQISEVQFTALCDSIKRFGFVDPIIINTHPDRKNIVIGGHQRIRAAETLGIKKVPCVELKLTYDMERELNIRLNKNTGAFDFDLLGNHFEIPELKEWGFEDWELPGPIDPDDSEPNEKELDENLETNNTCPKCGYEW